MSIKKGRLSQVFSVLILLFTVAVLYSARLKGWLIMGLMTVGFFKPPIPEAIPGQKLMPAPAMVVQNLNGKLIDLQEQKRKVIFINFWATWCPPCLAELPSINELYGKVKNNPDIVFLMIDVDNNLPASSQFITKNGYSFPVYGGRLDKLPIQIYSGSIPTTLVIDKSGRVVFNHVNRANYSDDRFANYLISLAKSN